MEKEIKTVPNQIYFDGYQIAKDIGSHRALNIVMLGAAAKFLDLDFNNLILGIKTVFGKKGTKIIDINIKAFVAGKTEADKIKN